jgi:lipopolysaccharide cholinephosphotransferase
MREVMPEIKDKLVFPTVESYPLKDIKCVQSRLLEMAVFVDYVFRKNNIAYSLAYGTLLGAVRHRGFIPWDDDFDIFVLDNDYDRAIAILQQELPNDIIVHNEQNDPIYWPCWSKLRDKFSETCAIGFPRDNLYKYKGICLDVYRLFSVRRGNIICSRRKGILKYWRTLFFYGGAVLPRFVCLKNLVTQYLKYWSSIIRKNFNSSNKNDSEVAYYSQINWPINAGLNHEDVFPLQNIKFEGHDFLCFSSPEVFLTTVYGDFMKIPVFDKRKPHYSSVHFYGRI